MVLAAEMPATIERIYAHFLHTPASVARYAAIMRGLPWSASGHAKDIWTSQEWELRRKLADADWLITCTKVAFTRLKDLVADSSRVQLFYHGLGLAHLPLPPIRECRRDGSDPANPVVILSVSRCVQKKGHDDLLDALARLPAQLHCVSSTLAAASWTKNSRGGPTVWALQIAARGSVRNRPQRCSLPTQVAIYSRSPARPQRMVTRRVCPTCFRRRATKAWRLFPLAPPALQSSLRMGSTAFWLLLPLLTNSAPRSRGWCVIPRFAPILALRLLMSSRPSFRSRMASTASPPPFLDHRARRLLTSELTKVFQVARLLFTT